MEFISFYYMFGLKFLYDIGWKGSFNCIIFYGNDIFLYVSKFFYMLGIRDGSIRYIKELYFVWIC